MNKGKGGKKRRVTGRRPSGGSRMPSCTDFGNPQVCQNANMDCEWCSTIGPGGGGYCTYAGGCAGAADQCSDFTNAYTCNGTSMNCEWCSVASWPAPLCVNAGSCNGSPPPGPPGGGGGPSGGYSGPTDPTGTIGGPGGWYGGGGTNTYAGCTGGCNLWTNYGQIGTQNALLQTYSCCPQNSSSGECTCNCYSAADLCGGYTFEGSCWIQDDCSPQVSGGW